MTLSSHILKILSYYDLTKPSLRCIVKVQIEENGVNTLMEVYERIRELRKNHLHLSQTDFGKKLGVSRSVINNIERNVLARPDQKLSLIKLICKEFSVNEDWLLNGIEPMFVEPDTFSLDEYVKQRGATDLELQIVKTYFDIDPDTREMLVDRFRKGLTTSTSTTAENPTIEDLEAEYIKSRSFFAQNMTSSALNTTDDDTETVSDFKKHMP